MKIGIHNEPGLGSWGGAEYSVVRLAASLARSHTVELIHHTASLPKAPLEAFSGDDLSAVGLRYVPSAPNPFPSPGPVWRSLRSDRDWYRSLSEPYDLFIHFTHGMPPFCHARRGILMVLFPLFDRYQQWPWKLSEPGQRVGVRQRLRRYAYERAWRQRLGTYQATLSNSHYTRQWTKKRWGVECEVVYPPVDSQFQDVAKQNLIVSVGRFVATGVVKKQLEMMQAYRELDGLLPGDCEYRCVGGLTDGVEEGRYADRVRQVADAGRGHAQVLTNISRAALTSIYEQGKVFWHATGYGEDDVTRPDRAEHFGIVTVEAMAAGCVPVVIDRGGQPEIVEHGVSGFLWKTLDELKDYTVRLFQDGALQVRMARAARERARLFTSQRYTDQFDAVIKALT